eukprot:TRINITY_DN3954_c0_g1_i1.p1 TRINITY_DN3954_c0_g1~~TRINITY_DN3954_c0_g1_i1.p1  ORF type:complete len:1187 (+),score=234.24 TRINITY_DN3954_c0_g1_i1:51-3611(+)
MDIASTWGVSCLLCSWVACGVAVGVVELGLHAAVAAAAGAVVGSVLSGCVYYVGRLYLAGPLSDMVSAAEGMTGVCGEFKHPERLEVFREISELKQRFISSEANYPAKYAQKDEEEPAPSKLPDARSTSLDALAEFVPLGPQVEAPSGKVTFVFTDIESSSNLWCDHPEEMKLAMRMHNNTMRQSYQRYNGYEVKTIGDAFMVTFSTASDAVSFCIEAQLALMNCDWPEDILLDSHCTPITKDGQLIYRGMRVRMGLHVGTVGVEVDPVTNRSDYYGHTVNIAARIEAVGKGGCIICSDDVIANLPSPASLPCTFVSLGSVDLKGVGEVALSGVLPNAISHRGTGLCLRKKKGIQGGSAGTGSDKMSTPKRSGNQGSLTTPGASGTAKSTFFKMLVKDMYNDRLLSDSLIRSTLNSFITSEELQPVNATVIQLRLTRNTEQLSGLLRALNNIAKRTLGMLLSAASTTVTIVWFCQQHAIQASSCAGLIYSELSSSHHIHLGMASGGVKLGVTHTGDDKHFITCIGAPIELSGALAEAAEQIGRPCLVPGTFVASVSSLARLLRPIDRWPFANITQAYVEVNELHLPGLEGVEKWDLLYGIQDDKTWVDAGYHTAFEAAKNGNLQLMEEVVKRSPNDDIAKRIVEWGGRQMTRTEFLPGTRISTQDATGAKEDLEAAWRRTTAASKSARAELLYMEGWAYDVSTFMHSHPGGREVIKPHFGTDITDVFHGGVGGHEHSLYAAEILRTLRVFKTNNLATNESNMLIVKDTWKELRAVGMKEVGTLLFRNLFTRSPDFLQLFPWGVEKNVYESKGLHDHGLQVMTAIDKAVTDLSHAHEVAHILHELGKTHIRYGIKQHMFDVMSEAFDTTFRQILQERYTPQVRYAWMASIRQVLAMAKDGIAIGRDTATANDALVVDEYRKIRFIRKQKRTATSTLYVFKIPGISDQHVPPGSHVSIRFNGKISRPYSILGVDDATDEVSFLIRPVEGSLSHRELSNLSSESFVEGRGLLLCEHQYMQGQNLILIGGGTGCVPLISLARAALVDGAKVWFLCCCDSYTECGLVHELEALFTNYPDLFSLKYLFTKAGYEPEASNASIPLVGDPIHAIQVTAQHLRNYLPPASETNHVIVCGTPEFNYTVREVVVSLDYTLSVLGMLRKGDGRQEMSSRDLTPNGNNLALPGLVVTAF